MDWEPTTITAGMPIIWQVLDGRAPFLQAGRGQADGEPAVEPPGPPLGTGEVRRDGPSGHFEAVTHAAQQPVDLLVTQVDLAREELADAGLADAAEAGQSDVGSARFAHHLTEHVASAGGST
jgi:hypothetical protein